MGLRQQLQQLMGKVLEYERRDKKRSVGQKITGVVLDRDENRITLSEPKPLTYTYDALPYWLATQDTFTAYIYVVHFELIVIAGFAPTPTVRRYLFICKHQRIDTLILDDNLPFAEADRLALEHADGLAQREMEPVFVFHAPVLGSDEVPLRDVGAAGIEYRERDRLEDAVGVVYEVRNDDVILRIGGYRQLIQLSNSPEWLQNLDVVFTALARYDPHHERLIMLRNFQPLCSLKVGDMLKYEIDNQIVPIRYEGSIVKADRQAVEWAKGIKNNPGPIVVVHRLDSEKKIDY